MFITTQTQGFRPFYLFAADGKRREIADIVFYENGVEVLSLGKGWIEPQSGRDMPGLMLNSEPRRSTKVNLTKGGHFYIPMKGDRYDRTGKARLYIDLASDVFKIGPARQIEMFANETGRTMIDVRPLTGLFGMNKSFTQTIDVSVPGSVVKIDNSFGGAIKALEVYTKDHADRSSGFMFHLERLVQDPKAVTLMVQACAASGKVEQNPTLQSAMQQLSVLLKLSV